MATAVLKLYEHVDQLEIIREWIYEHEAEIIAAGGELPPELAALADQVEGSLEQKVEQSGLFIRELIATAKAIEEEEKRLAARKRALLNTVEGLKGYVKAQLERAGIPKVQGKLVTVRVQANPPSVRCVLEAEQLAAAFRAGAEWVTEIPATYRVDARIIVEYSKAGHALPDGVAVERGSHLRIQ